MWALEENASPWQGQLCRQAAINIQHKAFSPVNPACQCNVVPTAVSDMLLAGVSAVHVVVVGPVRVQEGGCAVVIAILDNSTDQAKGWVGLLWEEDVDGVGGEGTVCVADPICRVTVQVVEVYPAHLADIRLDPEGDRKGAHNCCRKTSPGFGACCIAGLTSFNSATKHA